MKLMPTMQKRNVILAATALVVFLGTIYYVSRPQAPTEADLTQARAAVEGFGRVLKNVPLGGEPSQAAELIKDEYTPYVAPALLREWSDKPQSAPGRLTSSPWPERIEVYETVPNEDGSVTVRGNLIEVTSESLTGDAPPQAYVVKAELERRGGSWMIVDFEGGRARD